MHVVVPSGLVWLLSCVDRNHRIPPIQAPNVYPSSGPVRVLVFWNLSPQNLGVLKVEYLIRCVCDVVPHLLETLVTCSLVSTGIRNTLEFLTYMSVWFGLDLLEYAPH